MAQRTITGPQQFALEIPEFDLISVVGGVLMVLMLVALARYRQVAEKRLMEHEAAREAEEAKAAAAKAAARKKPAKAD